MFYIIRNIGKGKFVITAAISGALTLFQSKKEAKKFIKKTFLVELPTAIIKINLRDFL